ncbi:L-aspartate oxidase [Prochlorococcus marinus str. MIT 9312]|uniref:L-aspartate oxidase n=1 Tax=Prochlorococcus marinus (strain MIT 9312) TaxID=74546 RepID=Q31D80_PROM9|nr:L-aspartate oxidase [Prochlorococcus marinus]ABB49165.1 L-aspartate oxidase [Prochlorococcus marinus str. MIT 9312]KGF99595.1 L-aspartate oxidase [Prochlorococcus marinus str. MIT 9311]
MLRPPFSHEPIPLNNWDVIVIGAGAAGLMTCLELPANLKVLLLNRNTSKVSSSRWAQGGIASVVRQDDSFDLHADDTLKAGDGLCDFQAVEMLVKEAPGCVDRLQNLGMIFDQSFDQLATTLEAAHSRRRVLHVKDRTGRALVEVLEDHIENKKNILHCRGVRVTELLIENEECKGVQVLDGANLYWIKSRAVVLATGGGGHLFTNTTNPAQSSGEGIALAWKAGAAIEDLEFVQFHPTALKFYGAPCFLISEALRGEGAILIDKNGESPVKNLKNRDLATRDQVSRAIMKNMYDNNVDHVGLDLRYIDPEKLVERFPTILSRCQDYGVNPLNEIIPVAPAAHYWMGGVKTDLSASSTRKGLYAVGEVASTGVHGANRLASNSLMECLVFARKLSSIVLSDPPKFAKFDRSFQEFDIKDPKEDQISQIAEKIDELRKLCWSNLGVSRNKVNMSKFLDTIQDDMAQLQKNSLLNSLEKINFDQEIRLSEPNRRALNLLLDLKNRQITTITLLKACLFREESRGGHYRDDFPNKDKNWVCHTRQLLDKEIHKRFIKN